MRYIHTHTITHTHTNTHTPSKTKKNSTPSTPTQPKKKGILDLQKHLDKEVRVKFQGGREVKGVLKGFDQLVNLVLDETVEYLQDPDDPFKPSGETRKLGLIVCRGTVVMVVSPADGMEEIENPFAKPSE